MTDDGRRLRVLLVGDNPQAQGGIATHLHTLIEALEPHVNVRVFVSGSPGRDETSVQRFARRVAAPAYFAIALLRWRPDVVHLNPSFDRKALSRDLMFALVARAYQIPILVQIHGGNTARLLTNSVLDRNLSKLLLHLAGRVVILTEGQRKPLIATFPWLSARLTRAPNMVPPIPDRNGDEPPVEGQYILWMSRIIPGKGIFDVIDALNILRHDGTTCQLVIAGEGPDEASAAKYVQTLALDDRVVFLGHVTGPRKAQALAGAAIMVLPTFLPEGLPYTILEAMSYGVPVVASAVGGIPEVVDATTGILVPPRNPPALADALNRLLSDAALRERLGQAAMRRANDEFGVTNVTAIFTRLYGQLAERGGTAAVEGEVAQL